ncbi:MAG: hypothetical protein ACI3XT_08290 [Butyricicoccaceae bacterium]
MIFELPAHVHLPGRTAACGRFFIFIRTAESALENVRKLKNKMQSVYLLRKDSEKIWLKRQKKAPASPFGCKKGVFIV